MRTTFVLLIYVIILYLDKIICNITNPIDVTKFLLVSIWIAVFIDLLDIVEKIVKIVSIKNHSR